MKPLQNLMRHLQKLMPLVLTIMTTLSMSAQQQQVTGTVTDESGEPLIGATVMAQESGQGTATDLNGNYTIMANAQGSLRFSYVGYESKTVQVDGRNVINVTLQENNSFLDELVVVGYGTMKKSDLTGAVGSIGGKRYKGCPCQQCGAGPSGQDSRCQHCGWRETRRQCHN